jgi:hypothetical protein
LEIASELEQSRETLETKVEAAKKEVVAELATLSLLSFCTPSMLMSEQSVLDRAIVAIAMVTRSGYAPRLAVSESIVQNLDVLGFVTQSEVYTSLESANRALVMGLCNEKLLDRVTNGRGTLKGYKLTQKGEKRVMALKSLGVIDGIKFDDDWSDGIYDEPKKVLPKEEPKAIVEEPKKVSKEVDEFDAGYIEKLESFVKELKALNENVIAFKKLLEETQTERGDLVTHLSGVDLAIETKVKEKEDLETEIVRLRSKRADLERNIKGKDEDIESCVMELDDLNTKLQSLREIKLRG